MASQTQRHTTDVSDRVTGVVDELSRISSSQSHDSLQQVQMLGMDDLAEEPTGAPRAKRLLVTAGAIGLLVLLVVGAVSIFGLGDGTELQNVITKKIARGDIRVVVTGRGNLESASNLDIKCEVEGGSTITWIVEDGKRVKKGEKLVELDRSKLQEQYDQQTIAAYTAEANKAKAKKESVVASGLEDEYEEASKKELADLEAQVVIADENLSSAKNALDHSRRMFRKGYISQLQLEAHEFAVRRSELERDSAVMARDLLKLSTSKTKQEELEIQRIVSELQLKMESAVHQLEQNRLKHFKRQLGKCVIVAPRDGMVIYANERSRRSASIQIEEGATVREQQDIIRLPVLSEMQAKVMVNETKVGRLQLGMRATIRLALGREYRGEVTYIANQPERRSFLEANTKEYPVTIQITDDLKKHLFSVPAGPEEKLNDGRIVDSLRTTFEDHNEELPESQKVTVSVVEAQQEWQIDAGSTLYIVRRDDEELNIYKQDELKPGMTANTAIVVDHIHDAIRLPVTAVVAGKYCWVKTSKGVEQRILKLGKTDDTVYEVLDGVGEGELVVMNPRTAIPEARKVEEEAEAERAKRSRFGRGGDAAKAPQRKAPRGKAPRGDGSKRPNTAQKPQAQRDPMPPMRPPGANDEKPVAAGDGA